MKGHPNHEENLFKIFNGLINEIVLNFLLVGEYGPHPKDYCSAFLMRFSCHDRSIFPYDARNK